MMYRQLSLVVAAGTLLCLAALLCLVSAGTSFWALSEEVFWVNIAIYVVVISIIYRKKYFIYFDAWFVVLFPFYYLMAYFFSVRYDFSAIGASESTANIVLLICASTWMMSVTLMLVRPKAITPSDFMSAFFKSLQRFKMSHTSFSVVFPLALLVALFFLKSVSALNFSQLLSQSRLELVGQVSDTGWYMKYFIIAYSWFVVVYCFAVPLKTILCRIYIFIPIILYAASLVVVGSRRELVSIIIFACFCFYVYSKGQPNIKQALISAAFFGALLFVGLLRAQNEDHPLDSYINSFGEFLFPISTLYFYVENGTQDFLLGSSYFQLFYNFVPKAVFAEKPLSLAVEFAYLVASPSGDYVMGYAFTPITEAYLNFGVASIVILPILIGITSFFVEYFSRSNPYFTVIFVSQVLNFQRGELASFFFEIILLVACFLVCFVLSRGRLR